MEKIKLDPDQQRAVKHFEGPAFVVAGPGSGKTTVIKERILHLIREHKVKPENILAIAFTNAAADEMTNRLSDEPLLPKICTLHVFGKDLVKTHYKEAGLPHEPNNIWDDEKIREIINTEKSRLKIENEEKPVAIYKIEDKITHQCYIGQTRSPNKRKDQHFNRSSSRRLREAIQLKGKEAFDFTYEWVAGIEADREEAYRINSYRNRAAINLSKGHELINKENSYIPITIYKIESPNTVTCYFGQTTDLDSIDKPEGFEIIGEEETWDEASKRIELEIEKHKNWAVFNEEDPLHAQDSTRRRIEVFCEYFNASYNEVLEYSQNFEHEMRIFDRMHEDTIKEKSKVYTERFEPKKIGDPILRAFAKRYEDRKTEAKAIDFLDMLILSANMLEKHPELLHEYREKYRHVFVDEFQDISPVDFRLIKLFPENLFAVGDDDQAIYGFRGGDSKIMQNFRNGKGVKKYKVTRNYRSSSTIVRHAKALIKHNSYRISKNLRAENSAHSRVEVLKTLQDIVKHALLNELFPIVTTCETHFREKIPELDKSLLQELKVPEKIGILARNWYEVNPIQTHLKSILKKKGFQVFWSDSDDVQKRKLIMRRGRKKVEVGTIHSAKGREWEKVILLVNTSNRRKPSLPDERNNLEDERRLFYVAVTRAKQELVVLNGGNCQFIPEFQNVPPTKEELEEAFRVELAVQEPKIKKELEEVSKAALITLESRLKKELEKASKVARKQLEPELNRLRHTAAEHKDETKKMELVLPKQIKSTNDTFLEELIPVLDEFESQINRLPTSVESNDIPIDLALLTESFQLAYKQILDSLKNYGLRPMETYGKIFNTAYHEDVLPAIYSDRVQAGHVAREEQRGYLLHDQVIRKAQVVISKGENIREPERLDRVVDIYLNRLIFAFHAKYKLSNIDQDLIKQKMVEYLLKLDDESLQEIVSFSSKNKAETIQLKRYADYCVGQKKIHRCTGVFRDFWNKMWEVITTLNENIKQANTLLNQDFAQPVRFVTYAGFRDLSNIETFNDGVKGLNSQGEEVQLQNLNVLFAFPKDDMVSLKSYIKKRRDIANQNLQPIGLISERFHIAEDVLKSLLINRDTTISDNREEPTVRLVTRSGHVLWGHLRNFDDEFLYMDVNKKGVIVYRAGILEFKNLIWIEITKAYKNGTPINGYITGRVKGGLQVKFKLLTGFLPASQVEIKTVRNLNLYVGKTLKMKVTTLSISNNTIVFSRRVLLEEEQTKLFNVFREIPQEPITVRNIERIPKTAESILRTNGSSLFPKSEHIPVNKSISVIVPEPVEEMIDTPPPISIDFTESLDTYVKNLKPEFYKTVEIQRDPLYEPIDLIVPEPVKKVVDSRIPKPKNSLKVPNPQTQDITLDKTPIEIALDPLEILNGNMHSTLHGYEDFLKEQIQDLKPDTFEPSIVSDPPIALDNRAQETPKGHEDILNKQIQDLKPDTSDPENPDNVTQQPTLKTGVDRETPVESTALSRSDSSAEIDSDTHQIKERNSSENEVENTEKNLGYYLRRGGRFAVKTVKTILFKKPNS